MVGFHFVKNPYIEAKNRLHPIEARENRIPRRESGVIIFPVAFFHRDSVPKMEGAAWPAPAGHLERP
jgi:hypothetical protein